MYIPRHSMPYSSRRDSPGYSYCSGDIDAAAVTRSDVTMDKRTADDRIVHAAHADTSAVTRRITRPDDEIVKSQLAAILCIDNRTENASSVEDGGVRINIRPVRFTETPENFDSGGIDRHAVAARSQPGSVGVYTRQYVNIVHRERNRLCDRGIDGS